MYPSKLKTVKTCDIMILAPASWKSNANHLLSELLLATFPEKYLDVNKSGKCHCQPSHVVYKLYIFTDVSSSRGIRVVMSPARLSNGLKTKIFDELAQCFSQSNSKEIGYNLTTHVNRTSWGQFEFKILGNKVGTSIEYYCFLLK